jgi:hypothetical protein
MSAEHRKLTIEQAAQLIYQVDQPSPQQVGAVADLIKRGVLEGTRKGHWATTTDAVARYLATATLNKKSGEHQKRQPGQSNRADMESRTLRPVYRDLLKDYFMAVIRQRDARRRSKSFQNAVLGGQILAVVLIITTMVLVWRSATGVITPPELTAVERWLEQNTKRYTIQQWFPPEPSAGGAKIRVKYEYLSAASRRVQTDREFLVQDGNVVKVLGSE